MLNEHDLRVRLLLSAQRALLDSVPCSLRAVTLGWKGTEIIMHCIFDGEISEEHREFLAVAATEVIADFLSPYTISFECLRSDAPNDIWAHLLNDWAYIRYEKRE